METTVNNIPHRDNLELIKEAEEELMEAIKLSVSIKEPYLVRRSIEYVLNSFVLSELFNAFDKEGQADDLADMSMVREVLDAMVIYDTKCRIAKGYKKGE